LNNNPHKTVDELSPKDVSSKIVAENNIDFTTAGQYYIKYTVKVLLTPFGETLDNHLDMFGDIISAVADNDTLFADITFGPKPTPVVQMIALNYCMKNKKNVMIECISYGELDRKIEDRRLFDVTSLFYLDKVSDALAYSKVSDPESFIRTLIAGEV
jgi:hypothetical protein